MPGSVEYSLIRQPADIALLAQVDQHVSNALASRDQAIQGLVEALAGLPAVWAGADTIERQARIKGDEDEAELRAEAIEQLVEALAQQSIAWANADGAISNLLTEEKGARLSAVADLLDRIKRINSGLYPVERPGKTPAAFTAAAIGGDVDLLPPLDMSLYPIERVADGKGIKLSGSREIWTRRRFTIATGRLWRIRVRLVGMKDPADPLGDAVRVLLQWFNNNEQAIYDPIIAFTTPLRVADGVIEFTAYVGISGQTGVTIIRPPQAVEFMLGVKSFGIEGEVNILDVSAADVSDIEAAIMRLLPPDALPALSARIDQEIALRLELAAALGGQIEGEAWLRAAADQALSVSLDTVTDRLDAASRLIPGSEGYEPIVSDQDGRPHIAATPTGLYLARLQQEPTARLPITGGWTPLVAGAEDGAIALGVYDGVLYAPGALACPLPEPIAGLGWQQVMVTSADAVTLAPYNRRVTWGQQADLVPRAALAHDLIGVAGPDPLYPLGAVKAWPRQPVSSRLLILGVIGQSGAAGLTGNSLGVDDPTKITTQAPMPGVVLSFNGGVFPRQLGAGSNAIDVRITSDRFADVIDAHEDLAASSSRRESLTTAAAEVLAAALSGGTKILIFNLGVSGSKLELLTGDGNTDAAQWLNVKDLVAAGAAYASANGLTPEFAGLILQQGEANDSDSGAAYLARLDTLRAKTTALKAITGQTREIPIVVCQTNATANETGSVSQACLAQEQWCANRANFAALLPLYWSVTEDVATVHHLAQYHRYIGEACGHILAEMRLNGGYRHLRALAAYRRGRRVAVQMSEPVAIDRYGVTDPGALGVSYQDGSGAITVTGVEVDGAAILLTLGALPSGAETLRIGCHGAKYYAATNRYGLGARYGNRSCLRAPAPHWSHTTGRPLWRWAAQQTLPVSITP